MPQNGWTLARRKRQSKAIKQWKPWLRSTGPKTPDGKAITQKNAQKHGLRGALWLQLAQGFAGQTRYPLKAHTSFHTSFCLETMGF